MFFPFKGEPQGLHFLECSSLVVFYIDYPLNVASGKGVLKPEATKHNNNQGRLMEPLELVQGRGPRHPSSLDAGCRMGIKHPWERTRITPTLIGFWGTSHFMNEKKEAQEGKGLAPKSHKCPAQEGPGF